MSIWAQTVSTWVVVGAVFWDLDAAVFVTPQPASLKSQAFATVVVEFTTFWDLNASLSDVASGVVVGADDFTMMLIS